MFYAFPFNPYVAVIGDIVGSKKLSDRYGTQKKLRDVLDAVNARFAEDIASNFMITLGDEFQGLLRCGEPVIHIISEIEVKMYPIQIRFGIGVGEITTDINRNVPLGADGSAYYNARKMVAELKSMGKKIRTSKSDIMIASEGDNESVDLLLNSIFSLCSAIKKKWSKRQREIIFDCIVHGDNQQKTAERLGINQSSVYRGLSNARYYSYKNAMDTVSKALSEIGVNKNV